MLFDDPRPWIFIVKGKDFMSQQTEGTNVHDRGGPTVALLTRLVFGGLVFGLFACGGADSSEMASNPASDGVGGASMATGGPSTAPVGTGFIMMSRIGQIQLTEPSYVEQSDCAARISALADAEEYASCMEIPAAAVCLEVSEGSRESDRWWECFVQREGCEAAIAGHEIAMEIEGVVEIRQRCAETELASVLARM
jgi:hypothetical protein